MTEVIIGIVSFIMGSMLGVFLAALLYAARDRK